MAGTFGGASNHNVNVGSGASIDDCVPYTKMLLIYPTSLSAFSAIMQKGRFGTSTGKGISINGASPDELDLGVNRATTGTSYITNNANLTTNKWWMIYASYDPNAAAGQVGRICVGDFSTPMRECTYATATDGSGATNSDAGESMYIGNIPALDSSFTGRIAWAGYWNRRLSLDEARRIQRMFSPGAREPQDPRLIPGNRLWMPVGYHSMVSVQLDYSGWGNHGTVTGATRSEDPFDLIAEPSYRLVNPRRFWMPVGGTLFTQNVSGTVTSSALVTKSTGKPLAATLTSSGVLRKDTQRSLTATLSSSGLLAKLTSRFASGSIASSGSLIKTPDKVLSGTVTLQGSLLRSIDKVLSGTLTPVGVLIKDTLRLLTGAIASSGTLTAIKLILRSMSGSITPSGTTQQSVSKGLTGTVASSGLLQKATSKFFSAGLTPSGVLTTLKAVLRTFSGAIASTGTISNRTASEKTGSITSTGGLTKSTAKGLTASLTPSGLLIATRLVLLILTGALTLSGSITRTANKTLDGGLALAGTVQKSLSRLLSGLITLAGNLITFITGMDTRATATSSDSLLYTATTTNALVMTATSSNALLYTATASDSQT